MARGSNPPAATAGSSPADTGEWGAVSRVPAKLPPTTGTDRPRTTRALDPREASNR